MGKYIGFLVLVLSCSTFLRAESVWTGNASVGSSSQFPGSREYFRAASNSFPLGTILKVTNPKGRKSVNVTVTDRLETPGVFLLMEMSAAQVIGIPSDHIRPVQIVPIGSSSFENYAPDDSNALSGDSSTTDSFSNSQNPTPSEDEEADITTSSSQEESPVATTVTTSEPMMIHDLGDYNNAGTILNPVEVQNADRIVDQASIVDQETPETIPDETRNLIEEPENDREKQAGHEKQVFFLSPSEFRPPREATVESIEQETEQENEFGIARYETDDRGEYIQIGAYRNRGVFESRVDDIQRSNPDYPLRVAVISISDDPGQTVYKLLVGPIKPAEIGVVLDTVRKNSFSDAFPFTR